MDASDHIAVWDDDPGSPEARQTPGTRPAPELGTTPLPVGIDGDQPPVGVEAPDSSDFRYWVAADALNRGRLVWSKLVPSGTSWFMTVGPTLVARLDASQKLNAFYDRQGLEFAKELVAGTEVHSGESPDIVCHELGHAILDAIKPQLFHAGSIEVAAFHEAFGDISALLVGLELRSLREAVLSETGGQLFATSRVSRVAEQLGWALGQRRPDRVDKGALRDASNSWFYRDPETVPPDAPSSSLSTAPHSFSRIFSGAFLKAVAGMFDELTEKDEAGLAEVANHAGQMLVQAVILAPVVPTFFSQVAAGMIAAEQRLFQGRYREALRFAFIRHGVLSLEAAASEEAPAAPVGVAGEDGGLDPVVFNGGRYGFTGALVVESCSQPKRFEVAGSSPDTGPARSPGNDEAAASFVEDLFRQGRIDVGELTASGAIAAPLAYKTHALESNGEGAASLRRKRFDCGFAAALGR